jgi:acid stress-induced BolA-like protein IbaG/YrbA
MMGPEKVRQLIEQGIPDAKVLVQSDDNTHYNAVVVSESFAGKRPLARHQMVYKCLGKLMGNEIHALAIRAHTHDEWRDLEQAGNG